MRVKTPAGMARFDYNFNFGKITPEQARGLKYVSSGFSHNSKGFLSPKHADMVMKLIIRIRKEEAAERSRGAKVAHRNRVIAGLKELADTEGA